jgi:hypothetical protein
LIQRNLEIVRALLCHQIGRSLCKTCHKETPKLGYAVARLGRHIANIRRRQLNFRTLPDLGTGAKDFCVPKPGIAG